MSNGTQNFSSVLGQPGGAAQLNEEGDVVGPIQIYGDTAANLANLVPLLKQPMYATDTGKLAVGDGSTIFANLAGYFLSSGGTISGSVIISTGGLTVAAGDTELQGNLIVGEHLTSFSEVSLAQGGSYTDGLFFLNPATGTGSIGDANEDLHGTAIGFNDPSKQIFFMVNGGRWTFTGAAVTATITLPASTGTLALTSQIPATPGLTPVLTVSSDAGGLPLDSVGQIGIRTVSDPQFPIYIRNDGYAIVSQSSTGANKFIVEDGNLTVFGVTALGNVLILNGNAIDLDASGGTLSSIGGAVTASGTWTFGGSVNIGSANGSPAQLLSVISAPTNAAYAEIGDGNVTRLRLGFSWTSGPSSDITQSQIITDTSGNLFLATRSNNPSYISFLTNSATTATEALRLNEDQSASFGGSVSLNGNALNMGGGEIDACGTFTADYINTTSGGNLNCLSTATFAQGATFGAAVIVHGTTDANILLASAQAVIGGSSTGTAIQSRNDAANAVEPLYFSASEYNFFGSVPTTFGGQVAIVENIAGLGTSLLEVTNTNATGKAHALFTSDSGNNAFMGIFGSGTVVGALNGVGAFGSSNDIAIIASSNSSSGGTNAIRFRSQGYSATDDLVLNGGNAIFSGPASFAQYTVGTLPTGAEGQQAYATNGRKVGEVPTAGTGVPVYFSNPEWRVYSTDAQVAA